MRPLPGATPQNDRRFSEMGSKLMEKFASIRTERDELLATVKELQDKVASYEAQDLAEDMLLRAYEEDGAPSGLRPSSLPDFVSKRAALVERGTEHIKQASQLLEMSLNDGDFASLSDEDAHYDGPSLGGIPLHIHRR